MQWKPFEIAHRLLTDGRVIVGMGVLLALLVLVTER
jgi:hypothetical protein